MYTNNIGNPSQRKNTSNSRTNNSNRSSGVFGTPSNARGGLFGGLPPQGYQTFDMPTPPPGPNMYADISDLPSY